MPGRPSVHRKTMQPNEKNKYLTAAILVALVVIIFLWTLRMYG